VAHQLRVKQYRDEYEELLKEIWQDDLRIDANMQTDCVDTPALTAYLEEKHNIAFNFIDFLEWLYEDYEDVIEAKQKWWQDLLKEEA